MLCKEKLLGRKINISSKSILIFLFDDEEIVYIGKSTKYNSGINNHLNNKKFNSYLILEVDEENLDHMYLEYSKKYSPKYNTSNNPPKGYTSLSRVRKTTSGHLFNFILKQFNITTIRISENQIFYKADDIKSALVVCLEFGVAYFDETPNGTRKLRYNPANKSLVIDYLRGDQCE